MAGSEQQLLALIHRHKTALMRMAYMYLGDLSLAEEAVQDTFVKAYNHMDAFRGQASESTWLTRIAINTCKDMRRRSWFRLRKASVPMDAIPEQSQADTYPDDTVLRAVMALPPRDKQVILLRYYQGLSVAETAQALGISAACAASRLNRAKARLHTALKGWYFDEE